MASLRLILVLCLSALANATPQKTIFEPYGNDGDTVIFEPRGTHGSHRGSHGSHKRHHGSHMRHHVEPKANHGAPKVSPVGSPNGPNASPKEKQARPFFVFGDSLVDNGNNNFLITGARADMPPYGIDSSDHSPTGRFSNGLNIPDVISEYIGSEPVLPYLSPELAGQKLLIGANFASAGVGILNDTGFQFVNVLKMPLQLEYFKDYQQRLSLAIGEEESKQHVNRALVLISLGGNDFVNNYFLFPGSAMSQLHSLSDYVTYLIAEYRKILDTLYKLGARRVIVMGTGPLGCAPAERMQHSLTGDCATDLQAAAALFEPQLEQMVQDLNAKYHAHVFVAANTKLMHHDMITDPKAFGFVTSNTACCGQGPFNGMPGLCSLTSNLCPNRDEYVFWDAFHPTERACRIIVQQIMNGTQEYMKPMNLSVIMAVDSNIFPLAIIFTILAFTPILRVVSENNSPPDPNVENTRPAFFVFGDSLVDNGNNNYLATTARADSPPYGIDYPDHRPTGRFSNGLNLPDAIGEHIGADPVLPFLDPALTGQNLLNGANFASAGIGILNDTGIQFVNVIRMPYQLRDFEIYRGRLTDLIGTDKTKKLIDNALFLITCGGNDFVNNYFLIPNSIRSIQYKIPEYVPFIISEYQKILMRFYELGARKVLVTGTGPLGCVPASLARHSVKGECAADLQEAAELFNPQLVNMVASLNEKIGSKIFITVETNLMNLNFITNPKAFAVLKKRKGDEFHSSPLDS
ncbi:hypothetical protein E3N88_21559 [Mikania micrantha]|uniref:SGNH hydrolase-type esterase domain-containing protein n=1 Tax=Mikania micrantha TaxID=192012 RepID=A0A5N6NAI7_9ASTR|nr:hypothetical protein E3N88_21559 [Mikania micrantha]